MDREILNIILQTISGGFTGYITNTYAINMLFKEYTPFKIGGVIEKTKKEFIENISELVERDIINHKTLGKELKKDEFKGHVKTFVTDLLDTYLYEHIGDLKFGELREFDSSVIKTHEFLEAFLYKSTPHIIEDFFKKISVKQILSEKQTEFLIDNFITKLITELEESSIIEASTALLYGEQKNLKLGKIIDNDIERKIRKNIGDITLNYNKSLKEKYDFEVDSFLNEALISLNYKEILLKLQNQIGSKKIKELIKSSNSEELVVEVTDKAIAFVNSENGLKLIEDFCKEILELLKNIDKSLLDLISSEFRPSIEKYLQENLPYIITSVIKWIKENKIEIEILIEDTVDETVVSVGGTEGAVLDLIRSVFLNNIAEKYELVGKITDYLENSVDIEEISENLTGEVLSFLSSTSIQDIVYKLEEMNIVTYKNFAASLIKNLTKYLKHIPASVLEKIVDREIGEFYRLNLVKLFDDKIKDKLFNAVKKNYLYTSSFDKKIYSFIVKGFEKIVNQPLGALIQRENLKQNSSEIKKFIINTIEEKRDELYGFIKNSFFYGIQDKTIYEIMDDNLRREVINLIIDSILSNYHEIAERNRNVHANKVVSKINQVNSIDNFISQFILNYIDRNLETFLKGNVKDIVSKNLNSLNDDELCNVLHEFIGKELRPITSFGFILGAIAGFGLGVINPDDDILKLELSPINITLFAIVGYLTNFIALQMIFKPYNKNKLLSKIPFLKVFSEGYLVHNKPSFAVNMARFVEEALLDKKSINQVFEKNYETIKNNLVDSIINGNYEIVEDLLNHYGRALSKKVFQALEVYIDKEGEKAAGQLARLTANFKLEKLETKDRLELISTMIYDSIKNLEMAIYNETKDIIYDDKKINHFISPKLENRLKQMIEIRLNEQFELILNKVSDSQNVFNFLLSQSDKFDEYILKSVNELLDAKTLEAGKELFSKKLQSMLLSNDIKEKVITTITNLFNRKFSPDKKIGDLFEGAFGSFVYQRLDNILDSLTYRIKEGLFSFKDRIKKEAKTSVKKELGFFQVGIYVLLNGDNLIDRIVNTLIDQKLPKFIDNKKNEIKDIIYDVIDNKIFETKISDIKLKLNSCGLDKMISDFVSDKGNIMAMGKHLNYLSNGILDVITSIPLINYLSIINLDNLELIIERFREDILTTISDVISISQCKKKNAIELVNKRLYMLLDKTLLSTQISDCFREFSQDDIKKISSELWKIITTSKAVPNIINQFVEDFYVHQFKPKTIDQCIDLVNLQEDLELIITDLAHRDDFMENIYIVINDLINSMGVSRFDFIHDETKKQILDIAILASLDSLQNNLADGLRDISFKKITEDEINNMSSKEIHKLFKSFAGKYFRRLELYGIFGGIFGIHPAIGTGALALYKGKQALSNKKKADLDK